MSRTRTLSRKGSTAVDNDADIACPKSYKVSMSERMVTRERTGLETALENITAALEVVAEGGQLRNGGGDVDGVAIAADADLAASGDELPVRHSCGLTVDGDRSGESELGKGGAHYAAYIKICWLNVL